MPDLSRQNDCTSLRLLAAQRQMYSWTKRIRRCRTAVTVAFLLAPLLQSSHPELRSGVALLGVVWLLIANVLLRNVEAEHIRRAATIQEEFDVRLFGLPWNATLVGNRITPELTQAAARAYGNPSELVNWYEDPGRVPSTLGILLCQRSSVVWDWRLRRVYAGLLGMAFVGLVIWVLIAYLQQPLGVLILGLLVPWAPAIAQLIEAIRLHLRAAGQLQELEGIVAAMWNRALQGVGVSNEDCRHIQDRVFLHRRDGPLVPDRLYVWLRRRFQTDLRSSAGQLQLEAAEALRPKDTA